MRCEDAHPDFRHAKAQMMKAALRGRKIATRGAWILESLQPGSWFVKLPASQTACTIQMNSESPGGGKPLVTRSVVDT